MSRHLFPLRESLILMVAPSTSMPSGKETPTLSLMTRVVPAVPARSLALPPLTARLLTFQPLNAPRLIMSKTVGLPLHLHPTQRLTIWALQFLTLPPLVLLPSIHTSITVRLTPIISIILLPACRSILTLLISPVAAPRMATIVATLRPKT